MSDHPEVTIRGRLRVHIQDRPLDMFADETPNLWVRTLCGRYGRKDGEPDDTLHRCSVCKQRAHIQP